MSKKTNDPMDSKVAEDSFPSILKSGEPAPLPVEVLWNQDVGDFINGRTHERMGPKFYNDWKDRIGEFPLDKTPTGKSVQTDVSGATKEALNAKAAGVDLSGGIQGDANRDPVAADDLRGKTPVEDEDKE